MKNMDFKKLIPLIGIIILFLILFNLDFIEISNVFLSINPLYSLLAFFAPFPLMVFVIVEWQMLLKKQKINASSLYCLKNIFIGYFYGFITPGGVGAYTRSLYLKHESKEPLPKCVSNIIILNTIDFIALLLIGIVGGIILSSRFPFLFLTIVVISIFVTGLFLFFLKKDRSKIWFKKIIQTTVFKTIGDKLEDSLDSFYEDLPVFKDILLPLMLSIAGWIVKYMELFLISKLFAIEVPFVYFILMLAVADVVASLPISIYGLGTREIALISLFSVFDISPEKIVSLSLFWFVVIWLTPSIIGSVITVFETRKIGKLTLN